METRRLFHLILAFFSASILFFSISSDANAIPKVLIHVNRSGFFDVGIADANGFGFRFLFNTPKETEHVPVWSPNGHQIAFATAEHIMITDADGKNTRNVTGALGLVPAGSPAWSPDGKSLVFTVAEDPALITWNLYILDLERNRVTKLTHEVGRGDGDPVWSPDGTTIAYTSRRGDSPPEIFIIEKDGGNPRQITKGWDSSPTWSPDGNQIAFVRKENIVCPFRLWVVNADGSNPHAVPIQDAPLCLWVIEPIWLPDGRILFTHWTTNHVYTVDKDGQDLTLFLDLKAVDKELGNFAAVTSWFDPALAVFPKQKKLITLGQLKATSLGQNRSGK